MTEPREQASPPLRTWRPMAAWTAGSWWGALRRTQGRGGAVLRIIERE